MKEQFVYLNNRFVKEEQAMLSVKDLSIQRGYGIFDFLRLNGYQPLYLDDHLDRLYASADHLHLEPGLNRDDLKKIIAALIERNQFPDSGIRITVTGGLSPDGYQIAESSIIIAQLPIAPVPAHQLEKGIRLVTYDHERQLPQVKSIDYLMAIWLQPYIRQHQADDVLYQSNGIITECPRANFFVLTKDDRLLTTGHKVLKGITRKNLLQLVQGKYNIEEGKLSVSDLANAKEAFITSTTKLLVPVTFINGRPIGNGVPGPVSLQLRKELHDVLHSMKSVY